MVLITKQLTKIPAELAGMAPLFLQTLLGSRYGATVYFLLI